MLSFRLAGSLALIGALGLAGVPTLASAKSDHRPLVADQSPVAESVGGAAGPPVYPSIVNTRLVRAEAALQRLTVATDQNRVADANTELKFAAWNMKWAWLGAAYVIKTAPPPVASSGAVTYTPTGPPTAAPEDCGIAVLSLQHDFITTGVGLLNGAPATLAPALRSTIDATIKMRAAEVAYIKKIAPPPVAGSGSVSGAAGVEAYASGAPVAAGWDTLMPDVATMVTDEVQQLRGIRPSDGATALTFADWQSRDLSLAATINATWPPVPAG